MDFIPAKESPLFIKGFRWYCRWLFKRRFQHVWLKQEYEPCSSCKTLYFLNHHSWWDGLIPLLLNEFRFHQQARAMMEDRQMEKYSLFQKIGAFSISRENPRSAITSLRYAVRSFQRPRSSLFVYPEGMLTPSGSEMDFEGGLAWLHSRLDNVDIVPIGIHIHTLRHDKPELHLHVGRMMRIPDSLSREEKTALFEERLDNMLADLKATAGFDDSAFEKL